MKISPLVLAGLLAAGTCVVLWWRTGADDHAGPTVSGIGVEIAQSQNPSDAPASGLEEPGEAAQRGGVDLPLTPSTPGSAPAQAQPTPASAPQLPLSQVDLAKATSAELEAESKRLRDKVSEEAQPFLTAQLAKGQAEFISTEQKYTGRKEDSTDICSINYVPGSGVYRVVLSREEYPDLYAVKAQAEAIDVVLRERQQQAANLKHGK